jgi:hypothetical protein
MADLRVLARARTGLVAWAGENWLSTIVFVWAVSLRWGCLVDALVAAVVALPGSALTALLAAPATRFWRRWRDTRAQR